MEEKNIRYIVKSDCWFKEGTEATLLEYIYTDSKNLKWGLFNGTYVVTGNRGYDTFWHNRGYKAGDEVNANEVCCYNEFDIVIS